ncbi:MAG: competence/damage-inducible protein A [Bacteroidota bacterium]
MNSALITIGDEILIGQVTDTNAVWISTQLNRIGVSVGEMVTVSDEPGQITSTLDRYLGRYGLVIMTGGLGPTKDDLTKQTLATYFESSMVTVPAVLEKITAFFKERGRSMIDSNIRQADVPEICEVLMNNHGTAPGMWFEKDGTVLISLPGVPYEMKGLMEEQVLPRLGKLVDVPNVVHRTIMTQGVPESYLAVLLREWEEGLPDCIKLAYLPRPGIVRLRLTASGQCARESKEMLEVMESKLLKIIPQHIFGYDDISLEEALGVLLLEKGLSVATAESCTGGNIARLITSVPGSSGYYTGSVIAYKNRIKTEVLNVDESVINRLGVVSQPVVEQMAKGVQERFGTDAAIATSGIAGPDGGTDEKPVGTTWISVTYGDKVLAKKFRFGGTRERIIAQASYTAMQLLRRLILDMV